MSAEKLQQQLVVRVERDVRRRLEELAAENDRTLTQEVRRAIRLYLEDVRERLDGAS